MPVVGPFVSQADLEAAWVRAGGREAAKRTASAVAMAESRGGLHSYSPNPDGHTNWGAWQIDAAAPGDLLTLDGNARAAVERSDNGRNWCAWQTWDGRGCRPGPYNSAYRAYMGGSTAPASAPGSGQQAPVIRHAATPLAPPSNTGERSWDHSPALRAAAKARGGHAVVLNAAARGVLAKLGRWRLPR